MYWLIHRIAKVGSLSGEVKWILIMLKILSAETELIDKVKGWDFGARQSIFL